MIKKKKPKKQELQVRHHDRAFAKYVITLPNEETVDISDYDLNQSLLKDKDTLVLVAQCVLKYKRKQLMKESTNNDKELSKIITFLKSEEH